MMVAGFQHQGMLLSELLQDCEIATALPALPVMGLSLDSRHITAGDVFIAMHGSQHDGARFIHDAKAGGAVCALIDMDRSPDISIHGLPVIPVKNLQQQLGLIAARFYQFPSTEMRVTGVTGTNGKTSITWLLANAARNLGEPAGLIGTLGMGAVDRLTPSNNTTPDALTVQLMLRQLQRIDTKSVAMEVSSHALEQYRVDGTYFKQAIFTNLSREHLDYHGSMQAYGECKKRLFGRDFSAGEVILNLDDSFSQQIIAACQSAKIYGYSLNGYSDDLPEEQQLTATIVEQDLAGFSLQLKTPWGSLEYDTPLLGRFNISNLLACICSLCLSGFALDKVLEAMDEVPQVPGRMELLGDDGEPLVIVDYAHTPDALKHVLDTLQEHRPRQLICVFGCGGNRDAGKRPLMAEVVEQRADKLILTSDNPRQESITGIIDDMLQGIDNRDAVEIETDRASAIAAAIHSASAEDIVLIAGKGHEEYQDIKGQLLPFSDRKLALECLEKWHD